jgi:hypothetical protein
MWRGAWTFGVSIQFNLHTFNHCSFQWHPTNEEASLRSAMGYSESLHSGHAVHLPEQFVLRRRIAFGCCHFHGLSQFEI